MNNTTTANTASAAKDKRTPPTHVAYHVRDVGTGENKKSYWTRMGAAWAHADGQGFNIQIDCAPLDGRITLRVASEKKE